MKHDELIKKLRGCIGFRCRDCELKNADAIEELQKSKWIPVSEKLPEEFTDVLCYYEYFRYGEYNCMYRRIDVGYYAFNCWHGEAGRGHKNRVLFWIPLPEAPKEEKDG